MPEPRLLADEMVGRLARYLRMLGYDTVYARGWTDDEIVAGAIAEDRVVITRDRELARRTPRSILLRSGLLGDQLRAVRVALPEMPDDIAFERCTECNGRLELVTDLASEPVKPPGPPDRPRFRCRSCGHVYWEGSHTADVRRRWRGIRDEAQS